MYNISIHKIRSNKLKFYFPSETNHLSALESLDDYTLDKILQYLTLVDVYLLHTYVSPRFECPANYYYRRYANNCNYPLSFKGLNLIAILNQMGHFITTLTVEYTVGIKINCHHTLKKYCLNIENLNIVMKPRDYSDTETMSTECSSYTDKLCIRDFDSCSDTDSCNDFESSSDSEISSNDDEEDAAMIYTDINYSSDQEPQELLQLEGLKSLSISSYNETSNLTDDIILKCIIASRHTLESITLIGIKEITGKCLYELPINLKSLKLKWLSNLHADMLLNWNKNNHNLEYFENIFIDSSVAVRFGHITSEHWQCLQNVQSIKLTSTLCQRINISDVFRNLTRFEYVIRVFDETHSLNNILIQLSTCPNLQTFKVTGCAARSLKNIVIQPEARVTLRNFARLEVVSFINCPFFCSNLLTDLSYNLELREFYLSFTNKLREDKIKDFLRFLPNLQYLKVLDCTIPVKDDKSLIDILKSTKTFGGIFRYIRIHKIPSLKTWSDIEVRPSRYDVNEIEEVSYET